MAGTLILIVEDNEKNRKLIRDVLQVKGYQTLETETAEEGHNLAVEHHPAETPEKLVRGSSTKQVRLNLVDGVHSFAMTVRLNLSTYKLEG